MIKIPKRRSCKVCGKSFKPEKITNWGCCDNHQEEYAVSLISKVRERNRKSAEKLRLKKASQDRQELRQRKERLKPSGKLADEAQRAVNAYIRVRDYGKHCVSCGRWMDHDGEGYNRDSQVNAGHFRSVGAAPHLRFNTFNIHGQCIHCNMHLSGNREGYDSRLPFIVGQAKFVWLTNNNEIRRFSDDYYIRMKKVFTRRARHLKKIRERKASV